MRPLRIGVDARLISGRSGGVEQAIIGLADGFSRLADGDEEYLFLTYAGHDDWIRPYLTGPCRLLQVPYPTTAGWKRRLKSAVPVARTVWEWLSPIIGKRTVTIPRSDGTVERTGVDIMHFTTQQAFLTNVLNIYEPHDLQHIHLPEFFTRRERLLREVLYRTFCGQAAMVVAMTEWGRQDLIKQYGLPVDKVRVVPWASTLTAYMPPQAGDLAAIQRKYALPDRFIFYPAQTFPHKNHIRLLDALAILRDRRGLVVPLVCSGYRNRFYRTIENHLLDLRLGNQVTFLGFVSPVELYSLYKLCQGLVFPSKFEGWGLPISEAFMAGVPVICSNRTALPEQAGDAAHYFDPDDPEAIAEAIYRLWTDEAFRQDLAVRGQKRIEAFTWDRTARLFRAHYRRLARRPLTTEDRALLKNADGHHSPEQVYTHDDQ